LCITRVKAYHEQAVAAGIPALTTAGIYPGTSNVMAAHIVSISRGEYDDNWMYKTPTPGDPQVVVVRPVLY
jgi:saccharopine dehydrogenase-like NADP-dependent oxidoreductase